MEHVKKTREQR